MLKKTIKYLLFILLFFVALKFIHISYRTLHPFIVTGEVCPTAFVNDYYDGSLSACYQAFGWDLSYAFLPYIFVILILSLLIKLLLKNKDVEKHLED